jgi:hypothetical protein
MSDVEVGEVEKMCGLGAKGSGADVSIRSGEPRCWARICMKGVTTSSAVSCRRRWVMVVNLLGGVEKPVELCNSVDNAPILTTVTLCTSASLLLFSTVTGSSPDNNAREEEEGRGVVQQVRATSSRVIGLWLPEMRWRAMWSLPASARNLGR